MQMLTPSNSENGSLLSAYTAGLAEAQALQRAQSEVRAAKKEAALAVKSRAEFLANMNHELRTPLNAIIGFATMLGQADEYDLNEEKRASYASYILQSADLLLGHINLLLEAAAIDSDLKFDHRSVDLKDILDGAVKRVGVIATANEVEIENRSPEKVANAWADEERLAQAIDEILRTAVNLSPKGGRILVRAITDQDGWVELAVRDHSNGFTPEAITTITGGVSKVHQGLERSFAGSGIGLAVAKTFVELQGGHFLIKSKPGEGTLVRLRMPPPNSSANTSTKSDEAKSPTDPDHTGPLAG